MAIKMSQGYVMFLKGFSKNYSICILNNGLFINLKWSDQFFPKQPTLIATWKIKKTHQSSGWRFCQRPVRPFPPGTSALHSEYCEKIEKSKYKRSVHFSSKLYMQNKCHPSPKKKATGLFSQPTALPFHLDPGLSLGLSTTTCSILRPLPNGGHCRAALGEGVNEQQVWETESISTPSKGSLSPNHSPTESECRSGEIGVSPNMLLQSRTRHRHSCSEWPDTLR